MSGQDEKERAVADEMDRVDWGYDPDDAVVSPLVKTEQFFRDVPWDGDEPLEMNSWGAQRNKGVQGEGGAKDRQ